jgi:hypothetical protein
MPLNKYFKFIEEEAQLDKDFAEELKTNPLTLTRETAKFFRDSTAAKLDHYRCSRLASLLYKLLELADVGRPSYRHEVEDAFRDGWETGWSSCRIKVRDQGTTDVVYSADEFNPDWDSSQTNKKLEE